MRLCGVCILTDDAPRLSEFYRVALQSEPLVEGDHYSFDGAQLAVYNPGSVTVSEHKNMALMFFVEDLLAHYGRLLREIPGIVIISPPERRPWGAHSFHCLDSDGNTVSFVENAQ